MINLMVYSQDGSWDCTGLITTVSMSGDYQSCARRLDFEMLANSDGFVPVVPCELGSRVIFKNDGAVAFDGFIFSRQKSTNSSRMSVTCFDRGLYLKRNKAVYKFSGATPESIVKRVCADFGISVGALASTGVSISRNFSGVTLYQIIMTAYSLAAEQTGKSYMAIFRGENFCVEEKTKNANTLMLANGSNLMNASCTESIENMVNRIAIYDSDGNFLKNVEDGSMIAKYGRLQEIMKQPKKGEDVTLKAKKMLTEKGYSQKMTVENLGDMRCVTGGTVVVQEPYTGICGLFWIDGDTHTWKNGLYFNKLTLNFNSIMDTQEAGSVPAAGKGPDGGKAHYVNKPAEKINSGILSTRVQYREN